MRPAPLGLYQFSNLRIAAVIRPEIVPARMLAARPSILLGCAVGFRLRRFLFAIAFTSFPWSYYTTDISNAQLVISPNVRMNCCANC